MALRWPSWKKSSKPMPVEAWAAAVVGAAAVEAAADVADVDEGQVSFALTSRGSAKITFANPWNWFLKKKVTERFRIF